MLIDANITIAYKCSSCGSFDFFNLSLFKLIQKGEYNFKCHCKLSNLRITKCNSKSYKISMSCISCGNQHEYNFGRQDILNQRLNIICCPETGMPHFFIGSDEEVRKKVDSLESEFDTLIDMFGYDNYFKNTQVMFDTLNKIHDIAEQGNLLCECGNDDIRLVLLSNKINLICRKCPGNITIEAACNDDLGKILSKQQILLHTNPIKKIITAKER